MRQVRSNDNNNKFQINNNPKSKIANPKSCLAEATGVEPAREYFTRRFSKLLWLPISPRLLFVFGILEFKVQTLNSKFGLGGRIQTCENLFPKQVRIFICGTPRKKLALGKGLEPLFHDPESCVLPN